ncbi:MAG TPA: hypothetical protein VIH90_04145 [Candidatus Saccharimonadales bacterium]
MNKQITRRGVQIVLGVLWLLDGALQSQHQMFTSSFANNVIAPAAQNQPIIISSPMHFAVHLILLHPAIFNACFALIQLAIGAAILWKKTTRYGLIASIIWGISVWIGGEGLAGMASGHATLLMGAPGAALLYAILSFGVMPLKPKGKQQDNYPAYWLVLVWAILWIGGSVFQLLPGQNSVIEVSDMVSGMSVGAPSWLASLDNHAASAINGLGRSTGSMSSAHSITSQVTIPSMAGMHMQLHRAAPQTHNGYWFILLVVFIQLLIGVGVLYKGRWRKAAIGVGIVAALIYWVIGQSLGGYYSGLATDPNSGPLIVLLGIAVLGCNDLDNKLSQLYRKAEYLLVGKNS